MLLVGLLTLPATGLARPLGSGLVTELPPEGLPEEFPDVLPEAAVGPDVPAAPAPSWPPAALFASAGHGRVEARPQETPSTPAYCSSSTRNRTVTPPQ